VLALMVRGLALGQVGSSNLRPLVWKELRVALLNGLLIGGTVGLATWGWFGDHELAVVIFAAMIINLVSAALAGVLVPMTLKRLRLDPALAGGVVLTTVTDVMGFFS